MYNTKRLTIILSILIVLLLIFLLFLPNITQSVIAKNDNITVVVDAGHGGIDGGVTGGTTFVKESDLNLAISKKIAQNLNSSNITPILTRKTADGLYTGTGSNLKRKDMQNRRQIILQSGADFVISIHQNKFSDSSRRGMQVFYSENGNKNTIKFAHFMQNYLNKKVNIPTSNRGYTAQNGDFYIVKCSTVPTIIIECGFLSNIEDEKLLVDDKYQNKIAKIIVDGLKEFISKVNTDKIEGSV